jgi:polar amino acid transport system ATP-binding protein
VTPILALSGVSKQFGALRPLRVEALALSEGDAVAIVGLDSAAAETLTNLVTGAAIPDTGRVEVFGRATSAIVDSADWLGVVDRFGVVTDRAVLLDSMDVIQNLALPFTLDVDPPADDARQRASALAREVGLNEDTWEEKLGSLDDAVRARVRLARALALGPAVLLFEHPTTTLGPTDSRALGSLVRGIMASRRLAVLAVTADEEFARAAGLRVLHHDPANGRLRTRSHRWKVW